MVLQQFHKEENQMYIAKNDWSKFKTKNPNLSIYPIILLTEILYLDPSRK